MFKA
jgi:hypothetical protein